MLKCLAILTVFFAVAQAPVPIPGRTVKPAAQGGNQIQKQSGGNHGAPAPTSPLVNKPVQPDAANTDGGEVAGDDKKNAVTLTSLLPVTVAPITIVDKQKTVRDQFLDWGPWVFDFLLAIAAGLQVWLLKRTWAQIKRQADTMDNQAKEARESAAQATAIAKEAADAAKISADTAAGVSIPTLVIHEFETGYVGAADPRAFFQCPKVKITVKNYGQTPAFLKWWSLCFSCEDLPEVPIYGGRPGSGIFLHKVVVQSGDTYTLPDLLYSERQVFSKEDMEAIVGRKKGFCAYGYICYGDIFGNTIRRLKFCETVLNIFETGAICDWYEGLGPRQYAGIDLFPADEPAQQKTENPN